MWRSDLIILLLSFVISAAVIGILRFLSLRKKWLLSRQVPLVGGLGMGVSFVLLSSGALFFKKLFIPEAGAILVVSLLVLFFGLWDDMRELSVGGKLFFEIVAVYILIKMGARTYIVFVPEYLNIAVTFLWVLALVNAFNHLDILDGLASGVGIILGAGFFLISVFRGETLTSVLALIFVGVVLGFFVYNFPRAKVYMGNTGSHFLGFILAGIGMLISYASLERKIALFSPLLIAGFPLFDTLFLIVARLKRGISPFKKSKEHFALLCIKRGMSPRRAVSRVYFLSILFSTGGVLLSITTATAGIILILCFGVFSLWLLLNNLKYVEDK